MQVNKVALKDTQSFSQFFIDYLSNKQELAPFYGLRPEIDAFGEQIDRKSFSNLNRKVLCEVLEDQYEGYEVAPTLAGNLTDLALPNTYTVTTGHQLNIFTGPLYFIYKIATVVNACRELKVKYPDSNFVPVYWMASEDHDFDEISYFHLFGKKYQWECPGQGGVGRLSTESLTGLLEELPEKVALFEQAYRDHGNLADAVRCYVNDLFGEDGLVVLDADDDRLKKLFSPMIKDDLLHHSANTLVEQTNDELAQLGYKTQIFPREINFFYLDDGVRERIVKEDGQYLVNNTELSFSETEILALLDSNPEKFSPNVVMRPLYQEVILPNLAYVGGPAEVIYWLQLGKVFEKHEVTFPILLPRNFALYINGASQKKLAKFGWSDEQLFQSIDELQAQYVTTHGSDEVTLNGEYRDLEAVFEQLIEKAEVIDGSLKGFISAEHTKAVKSIDNIGKRLKKSEERKHETELNQIASVKEKLFPRGGLQERHDNFLNFYINNPNFVKELLVALDPFDLQMHVLKEG
ncbi:bacillithiol biosynthesis cysteine-adding enzyme BshC [Reichenbachiella agariperforans]|uniref:Putative cysteine ligase BshC n=1 Tax=Reichenbachiella agariperforans TaxID=156994 RepID=A0A1M6RKJ1_REIAG|nr:bacillithiol biosynthesis cysteine-adding enzyme BshC [Reichenbachiella agariperforans]SHK32857.1 bacillithiol biosynthesis cysteine-adding enzyme BshC [Reichenbachiella agariperforans]